MSSDFSGGRVGSPLPPGGCDSPGQRVRGGTPNAMHQSRFAVAVPADEMARVHARSDVATSVSGNDRSKVRRSITAPVSTRKSIPRMPLISKP